MYKRATMYAYVCGLVLSHADTTDLARGKPTSQVSTGWNGVSSRAVDGNTNPSYFGGNTCQHTMKQKYAWWSVDLGKAYQVTRVAVTSRDCLRERSKDYRVAVTNTAPPPKAAADLVGYTQCGQFSGTPGVNSSVTCAAAAIGRYVFVYLPNDNYLTMCEVQVYGHTPVGTTNIARGKTTSQVSTGWSGVSSRAVDGNTNPSYFGGNTCQHTMKQKYAWWSVDLGKIYQVTRVAVTSRDCLRERSKDYRVAVTNTAPPPKAAADLVGYTQCGQFSGIPGVNSSVTCAAAAKGRYVFVYLPNDNYLTMCEVQVYGHTPVGTTNLARGKITSQISTGWNGVSSRAVDGNTNPSYFGGNTCQHTLKKKYAWWSVDLGKTYQVSRVAVTSRDCLRARSKDYRVAVTDTGPPPKKLSDLTGYTHCGQFNGVPGVNSSVTCAPEAIGRYVYVYLPNNNYLTMCEVQVYGHIKEDYSRICQTGLGKEYIGTVRQTVSGKTCQKWTAQSPHKHTRDKMPFPDTDVAHALNYCRNPDNTSGGVWCYTTDPNKRWEFCGVPTCETLCQNGLGKEYIGQTGHSDSGRTCQGWDKQTPHKQSRGAMAFPDKPLANRKNYCRNPDNEPGGVWCYTTDAKKRWEYCDVPRCRLMEEDQNNLARGKPTSQVSTGWSGASSRAVDGNTNPSYFGGNTCQHTLKLKYAWWSVDLGKTYQVTRVAVTSRDCLRERSANYHVAVTNVAPPPKAVRNLDGYSRCGQYAGTPGVNTIVACAAEAIGRYTYIYLPDNNYLTMCEVQVYGHTPVECQTGKLGKDYTGKLDKTKSGKSCQRWDSQFPHKHTRDKMPFPEKSATAAENYCRNPDNHKGGVWCYTTNKSKRWEECDVPRCEAESQEGLGKEYIGKMSRTISGRTCQRWDSQSPHKHTRNTMKFPDKNLAGAANSCRNPDNEPGGVWCYTTDSAKRWEHCDVPKRDTFGASHSNVSTTVEEAPVEDTPQSPCESGWSHHHGACYKASKVKKEWSAAKDECIKLGSNLTSVLNADEQAFVVELLKKINVSEAWMGMQLSDMGEISWIDGATETDYAPWDLEAMDPNEFGGGDACGRVYKDVWRDRPRDMKFGYICSKPGCGDWDFYDDGCYKVLKPDGGKTWEEAKEECENRGAELTSILSQGEMDFVADLMSGNNVNEAWMGMKLDKKAKFTWVDGRAKTTYTNWDTASRDPNEYGGGTACGRIYDKKWRDRKCDKKFAMVCRKGD